MFLIVGYNQLNRKTIVLEEAETYQTAAQLVKYLELEVPWYISVCITTSREVI